MQSCLLFHSTIIPHTSKAVFVFSATLHRAKAETVARIICLDYNQHIIVAFLLSAEKGVADEITKKLLLRSEKETLQMSVYS